MTDKTSKYMDAISSPLGDINIIWSDAGLHYVEFADLGTRFADAMKTLCPEKAPPGLIDTTPYPGAFARYFDGDMDAWSDLPVCLDGTDFQMSVWRELRSIGAGETRTYGNMATEVGHPGAARAVGSANGQNPVAIVIPCHRVIGAGGRLAGYGGGLDRKSWLLSHEGAQFI